MCKKAKHRDVLISIRERGYAVIHDSKLVAIDKQEGSSESPYADDLDRAVVEPVV
jgi:hypothetical protein